MNSLNDTESFCLDLQTPPKTSPSNESTIQEINGHYSKSNQKKTSIIRTRFAPQEDKEILRLVSLYGYKDWSKISSELSKSSNNFIQKTPRQCRDRYVNYLSPNIKKGEWTLEEDQCLVHNYVMSLFNLKSMKKLLPGRSEVAIKNRMKHLSKFGIGIIKSTIDKNLQTNEQSLVNSNLNSNLFLNKFNINFDQFYSNQVKSVVTDIFNNSPLVLTSIKDNHLIINNKNNNNASTDVNNEETNNIDISDFSQFESENESLDQLYWNDMYM